MEAEKDVAVAQEAMDDVDRAAKEATAPTPQAVVVDEAELGGGEQYVPLKIQDCRMEPKRKASVGSPEYVQVRIEWQRYPKKADWTWEPLENFCSHEYVGLLANYFDKTIRGRKMSKYLPK